MVGAGAAATYGDAIADVYDELLEPMAEATAAAVAFLARLAPGGRALELGVGTGRVALPLAAAGLRVHGIDESPRMLARLRAKPGGAAIATTLGDFGDVDVPGAFDLAYVVFNTFYGLLTQERQVACMQAVTARLRPGGRFVVEAFVPPVPRFDGREPEVARGAGPAQSLLEVARHDPVAQRLDARQVVATPSGVRVLPVRMRYVWPAELDLMARLAGLGLVERLGGWCGERFTARNPAHVSVYEAPPA